MPAEPGETRLHAVHSCGIEKPRRRRDRPSARLQPTAERPYGLPKELDDREVSAASKKRYAFHLGDALPDSGRAPPRPRKVFLVPAATTGIGNQTKTRRQQADPRLHRKRVADPTLARSAKPSALLGIADQTLQFSGKRTRIVWRNEQSGDFRFDQLRDCRYACRNTGKPLALRLDQHIWQSVAVAVFGDLAGESEDVRLAVSVEHLRLGPGSPP